MKTRTCQSCGETIIEGEGYCDSDKCLREAKDYEEFVQKHGDYCFSCYQKGNIVPPVVISNAHFCPNCGGNENVVPTFDLEHKQNGWVCLVCYWGMDC